MVMTENLPWDVFCFWPNLLRKKSPGTIILFVAALLSSSGNLCMMLSTWWEYHLLSTATILAIMWSSYPCSNPKALVAKLLMWSCMFSWGLDHLIELKCIANEEQHFVSTVTPSMSWCRVMSSRPGVQTADVQHFLKGICVLSGITFRLRRGGFWGQHPFQRWERACFQLTSALRREKKTINNISHHQICALMRFYEEIMA